MDTAWSVVTLAGFAGGFIVVGVGVGLGIYHFALGWFISRTGKRHLDAAVGAAEKHQLRRTERRHGREREKRILAEGRGEAPSAPAGRHLAR